MKQSWPTTSGYARHSAGSATDKSADRHPRPAKHPAGVWPAAAVSVKLRDNADEQRRTSANVCGPSAQVRAASAPGSTNAQVASGRRSRALSAEVVGPVWANALEIPVG